MLVSISKGKKVKNPHDGHEYQEGDAGQKEYDFKLRGKNTTFWTKEPFEVLMEVLSCWVSS